MTMRIALAVCLLAAIPLVGQEQPPAPPELPVVPEMDVLLQAEPTVPAPERELAVLGESSPTIGTDADATGTNGALLLDGSSDVVLKVFTGPLRFLTNTGSERMRITSDGRVGINHTNPSIARLVVQHGEDNSTGLFVTHQPTFELGSPTQNDYGLFVQTNEAVASGAANSGNIYGGYLTATLTGPGTLASALGALIQSGTGPGSAGGTLTAAVAARLRISAAADSTITNGYGLIIDDVPATNAYGIYQSHSSDNNFLAGKVGIGITQPANLLHLSASSDPAIRLNHWNAASPTNAIYFYEGGSSLFGFINQRGSAHATEPYQFNLGNNHASGHTALFAGGSRRMTLYANGNVGIGTTSAPAEKLYVAGNVHVTGAITGATVIGAVYQDVAEWVPASVDMEPGTVVVLNHARNNEVMPSQTPYDTSVAGVVSAQPGVLLGVAGDSKEQIATTGRVKVRVDASKGPVRVGDLLVTSDVPGTAMRSEPTEINGRRFHQPGTIIGKALEPLEGGVGEILVLLSLQ